MKRRFCIICVFGEIALTRAARAARGAEAVLDRKLCVLELVESEWRDERGIVGLICVGGDF